MTPVTPGMALQVAKGAHFVYVSRKERKEAGELIEAALRESICPGDCDFSASESLAERIAARLADTPFPREEKPTLRERFLIGPLRQKLPGAGDLTGQSFSERLGRWVVTGMEDPRLVEELESYRCDGYRVDPAAIATRFVANLHTQLVDSPESRFRTALAQELEEAESFRKWRAEVKRRGAEAIAGTATLGVAAGGVAELAGVGDPALIGAGVAVATAVAGAIRVGSTRSDRSPLQESAMGVATGWVEDMLFELAGKEHGKRASSETSLRLWADQLLADDESKVWVSPELMADLAARVIPAARDAQAENLEVALRGLEDAVERRRHGRHCSLREPLTALLDVIGEGAVVGSGCVEKPRNGLVKW